MPLDPWLAARVHLIAGLRWEELDGSAAAARMAAFQQDPGEWSLPDVRVEDRAVDGPHGRIPVRTYAPQARPRGALLWVHGGGFGSGSLDMRESHVVAAELAARSGSEVVTVDYRLAGDQVRYPVPADDVHAAWQWLHARSAAAGIPASLGGASAGAALALTAALRARDAGAPLPQRLLLAYPFAHFPVPSSADADRHVLAALPRLLRFHPGDVEAMVRRYVGRITDLPAYALPGEAPLHGLPPTCLLLSEYDELRPSGELLARQLADSGGAVHRHLARGMPHGHLDRTPALAEVDRSLDWLAEALAGQRDSG